MAPKASAPIALAALALVGGCFSDSVQQRTLVSAQPSAPEGVLFADVAVFTATDRGLLQHQDVLVQGDRIVWVRPSAAVESRPANVSVVDGGGRTLLPGYIDTHTHLTGSGAALWEPLDANMPHNLEAWLYAGVTTIYDLGGFAGDIKEHKAAVDDGELLGPRIFFTHLPGTAKGGHPIPLAKSMMPWPLSLAIAFIAPQLETEDDARAFVDDTLGEGADYIKLIYDRIPTTGTRMDASVLKAAIARAHEQEVKVFVHIGTADEAVTACEAGADVIAHGPYRSTLTVEQARTLAERPCPVIFTLAGWEGVHGIATRTYQPSPMAKEITPPEVLDPVTGAAPDRAPAHPIFSDLESTTRTFHDAWKVNAKRLYDAGVPVLIGTDAPLPGAYPGSSFHEELVLLAEAGIPTEALLWSATAGAAHLLTDTPDFGSVEEGKAADLVLVNGDPTVDIHAAGDIVTVMRAGQLIERHRPADAAR